MSALGKLSPDRILRKLRSIILEDSAPETDSLSRIALGPGDIALDCGANVGNVTTRMASTGAVVYAFEPNPHAYSALEKRFAGAPNVHTINKAVLDRNDSMRLYLHENAGEDPIKWSTGSSLLDFKGNVNTETYVDVETIDLAAFIEDLNTNVKVVKMDIEGSEVQVINKMIDTGIIRKIEHLLVETHDKKVPELREDTDTLRQRIADNNLTNIDLEWI